MIASPYEKYRQSAVQTANPAQLVLMLYEGAIRFVRIGIEGIGKHDLYKANQNLGKAQTIVSELMSTLDYSYDISKNLFAMYEYINYLLIQSNVKKSIEPAQEALGYLMDLYETWIQVSKTGMSGGSDNVQHG